MWFGYVNAFLYILLKYFIYGFAIKAIIVSNIILENYEYILIPRA